jgi:hypothetical protein
LRSLRLSHVIRYEVSRDTVEPRQFLWMSRNVV